MSEVTLTAAVRDNLLSLQNTSTLISRTQGRLSTGLRVASAIDDPVAFFQAKGLTDRADDFAEKKQGIDQGISTLTAASDAMTAIESLVRQLKGLATNAKSATTSTEIETIVTQFNDLRKQINNLTRDATYQGMNLVNGTGKTLAVNFSNDSASLLNVKSVDVTPDGNGLKIAELVEVTSRTQTNINFDAGFVTAGTIESPGNLLASADGGLDKVGSTVTGGTKLTFTIDAASATTISAGDSFTLAYDGLTFTVNVYTAKSADPTLAGSFITAGTFAVGEKLEFVVVTGHISAQSNSSGYSAHAGGSNGYGVSDADTHRFSVLGSAGVGILRVAASAVAVTATAEKKYIGVGTTVALNDRIANLDSALTTLRSQSKTLGSNVAVLKTRLDFTTNYVNTLTAGGGKLTLADLNQEGANLLALQTRQQLGIQSLAFAGQSEQAILGLFR